MPCPVGAFRITFSFGAPLSGECWPGPLCLEFLEKVITFSPPQRVAALEIRIGLGFELGGREIFKNSFNALARAAT